MKYLLINVVCGNKSTGRICLDLAKDLSLQGHSVRIAYGRENIPDEARQYAYKIGNDFDVKINALLCRLFDNAGFGTKKYTKKFVKWIEEYDPDVIMIHNIHGYYINVEVLFRYLKKCGKQIVWTLHDCWAFTGHCCHFSYVRCEKWKTGCYKCPQKKIYPESILLDRSEANYRRKKELFSDIPNLKLQVPSEWLKKLVKQSFLKEYDVTVVPNKVDDAVFRPVESNIREKLGLTDKKLILGVASRWYRKGLSDFHKLAGMISENYVILLIGLSQEQIQKLPNSRIIGYPPTNNVSRLVEIYSAADVTVSMSREETFGLTVLESIKCGTPAIVYKDTACQEIAEMYGGIAVSQDVSEVWNAIQNLCGVN